MPSRLRWATSPCQFHRSPGYSLQESTVSLSPSAHAHSQRTHRSRTEHACAMPWLFWWACRWCSGRWWTSWRVEREGAVGVWAGLGVSPGRQRRCARRRVHRGSRTRGGPGTWREVSHFIGAKEEAQAEGSRAREPCITHRESVVRTVTPSAAAYLARGLHRRAENAPPPAKGCQGRGTCARPGSPPVARPHTTGSPSRVPSS